MQVYNLYVTVAIPKHEEACFLFTNILIIINWVRRPTENSGDLHKKNQIKKCPKETKRTGIT